MWKYKSKIPVDSYPVPDTVNIEKYMNVFFRTL